MHFEARFRVEEMFELHWLGIKILTPINFKLSIKRLLKQKLQVDTKWMKNTEFLSSLLSFAVLPPFTRDLI